MSARVSVLIYNPSLISAPPAADLGAAAGQPEVQGQAGVRAAGETDFQPIVTSVARAYGNAEATLSWLKAIKANAGVHIYPDNETIADEVNRGAVAFGVVNQYYWYRMRAEIGASNMHSKIAYFAPHDPGYVVDVSGAGDPEVLQAPGRRAEVPRLPGLQAGPGDHRHEQVDQLRVPDRRRRDHPAPETPFASSSRTRSRIAELGDGSTAIALLREAGLL